jgi:hypothetical protein
MAKCSCNSGRCYLHRDETRNYCYDQGTKVLQQEKKIKTESKTNSSKELALVKKEAKKFG